MSSPGLSNADDALQGQLSDIGLPRLLGTIQESNQTGVLSLVNADVRKQLHFREGRLVFAASSMTRDRLGDVLLRLGKLTREEYQRLYQRIRGGHRLGKMLVESGLLAPKDLWLGVQQQVMEIVWSLFNWGEGYFYFEKSDQPRNEKITVDIDVERVIIEGIRRSDGNVAVREEYLTRDSILKGTGKQSPVPIEPHERHVLDLIDGKRPLGAVFQDSEIGEAASLKVLHTFLAIGVVELVGRKQAPLEETLNGNESHVDVVEVYNRMYRRLFKKMSEEVGPIAAIILEKYLNEIKESPSNLFHRVQLLQDGSLDAGIVAANAAVIPQDERRDRLISSLNELLYSELLAVKRTLGASHESELIQVFREIRNEE